MMLLVADGGRLYRRCSMTWSVSHQQGIHNMSCCRDAEYYLPAPFTHEAKSGGDVEEWP